MRLMKFWIPGCLVALFAVQASSVAQAAPEADAEGASEVSECSSNCVLTITRGNNVTVLLTRPDGKKERLLSYEIPADHPDFRKSVLAGSEPEVRTHVLGPRADATDTGDCMSGKGGGGHDDWGWELFVVIGSVELPGGAFITSVYIGAGQQVVTIELPDGDGSSLVQEAPIEPDSGCLSQN